MKKHSLILMVLLAVWACQDLNPVDAPAEFDLNSHFGVYVDTSFNPCHFQTSFFSWFHMLDLLLLHEGVNILLPPSPSNPTHTTSSIKPAE